MKVPLRLLPGLFAFLLLTCSPSVWRASPPYVWRASPPFVWRASSALADEIRLKDGTVVKGAIILGSPDIGGAEDFIVIQDEGGRRASFRRDDVAAIQKSTTTPPAGLPPEKVAFFVEYQRRKSEIKPGEIEKNLQLADWCRRNGLPDQGKAEIIAALSAEEPDALKKTFAFCLRNKLDDYLLETPSKFINPKLAAMKEAGDPQFRTCSEFLQLKRRLADAPAYIAQLEDEVADIPDQREALQDRYKQLDEWLASARGKPVYDLCPVCSGAGYITLQFGLPIRRNYPNPPVILLPEWTPRMFGYYILGCANCNGTGLIPNGLQQRLDQATAQQKDIRQKLAGLDEQARKLDLDIKDSRLLLESLKREIEIRRAAIVQPFEAAAPGK